VDANPDAKKEGPNRAVAEPATPAFETCLRNCRLDGRLER
jgi:hypothetical protein